MSHHHRMYRFRTRAQVSPLRAFYGFTVLEVFAVVILLGTLFALSINSMDFSANKWSSRPARESLIRAIGEAHNQSRLYKEDLFLRYSSEESALLIEDAQGKQIQRIPLNNGEVSAITFYRILPEKERSQAPAYEPEEEPVRTIVFSPSGSSTPMLIEVDSEHGRNILRFDPFSLKLVQDAVN